jgi:hypothetical protein
MFLFDGSRNRLARASEGASVRHGVVALCGSDPKGRGDAGMQRLTRGGVAARTSMFLFDGELKGTGSRL